MPQTQGSFQRLLHPREQTDACSIRRGSHDAFPSSLHTHLLTLVSLLFLVTYRERVSRAFLSHGCFVSVHQFSQMLLFVTQGHDYRILHSALWTLALSRGLPQVGQLPDWTYSPSLASAPWLRLGFCCRKFVIPNTPRHEQCNRAAASKHSPQQELL